MRADQGALVALDTVGWVPLRNDGGDATFLVGCCTCWECAVDDVFECAHWEVITALGDHWTHHLVDELRIVGVVLEHEVCCAVEFCPFGWDFNLLDLTAAVDSCVVHVDDVFTLLTVALHDELLHLLNCEVVRDNA